MNVWTTYEGYTPFQENDTVIGGVGVGRGVGRVL
jgi:hypothetical protein